MMKWKDNVDEINVKQKNGKKRTLSQIQQDLETHEQCKPLKLSNQNINNKHKIAFDHGRYEELNAKYSDINLASYHQPVDCKKYDELRKKWGNNEVWVMICQRHCKFQKNHW